MRTQTLYREAIAERDRLQRELARMAAAVVPGGIDPTWVRRRELADEIKRQEALADDLMTQWIAENAEREKETGHE